MVGQPIASLSEAVWNVVPAAVVIPGREGGKSRCLAVFQIIAPGVRNAL